MACHNCGNANVLPERKKDLNLSVGNFNGTFPVVTKYCKECDNDHWNASEILEAEHTLARKILESKDELTGEEFKFARKYLNTKHKDIFDLLGMNPFKVLKLEEAKNTKMPKELVDKLREIPRP